MHKDSTPVMDRERHPGPLLFAVPRELDRIYETFGSPEPTVYFSHASPENLNEARGHIRNVIGDLTRLSHTFNAHAYDDDFDQPNAADQAIDELGLALAALAGGGA